MLDTFIARGGFHRAQIATTSAAQYPLTDTASSAAQAATASQPNRTAEATWSDVPPPAKLLGLAGARYCIL